MEEECEEARLALISGLLANSTVIDYDGAVEVCASVCSALIKFLACSLTPLATLPLGLLGAVHAGVRRAATFKPSVPCMQKRRGAAEPQP